MSKHLTKISSIIDEISMGPFGSNIKVENFVNDGVPVLNGSNLSGFKLVEDTFKYVTFEKAKTFKKAIAKRGDIVITHRGTLGQISFIPDNSKFDEYIISQSQFRVALNRKKVDPAFFVYFFHTFEGQKRLLANKCHVGVPALAQATTNFKLVEIPLPDLNTQKKIASVLSSLDSKIELNNRINAELEAMAKTIYDYWFVQFDFPNAEGKPYKSSGGKMILCEELKREIPVGWNSGELQEIANIKMGQSPPGDTYNSEGDGMIFYQGCTDFGNRFPTVRQYTTQPTRFAKEGDILLSVRAPVGTLNIAKEDCCIGRGLAALNSKDNCIAYLFGVMVNLKQVFDRRNTDGTTFGSITKDDLFKLNVVRPNKDILKQYHNLISPAFEKQNQIANENIQLSSLRDWLLPMLMNGQVKVSDLDEEVETLIAAEPIAEYKCSKSQWENYHKIESVYAILWANKLLGVQQGEMALAKDTYLVDKIAGLNTGFTFAQHNWGSYDPTFKKTINNKQYFVRRNFENSKATYFDLNDNEKLLARIPETTKEAVRKTIEELHAKIFDKYHWSRKAEMKELYATVLKCIEDTQSIDLAVIRQAMKDWKTPKQDFPDKATKFSEAQTIETLEVIVKEGWSLKVLRD